ncbi:MAG: response regulator [Desulfobacula sp.]|uniref:chemotaxis protein CheB n=1 Tax=Desulfobacula sp. TaxID=2593537 RepID=UPI0025C3CDB8|nr:chemotaxis protein CheB [Desulfobacula sp.]MCD4720891.1 response regulator [Desulfobacula sp.]
MIDKLDIIIADENPGFVQLLKKMCGSINGINILGVAHSERMLIAKINHVNPDLIFLDLTSGMGGIRIVDTIRKINSDLNVIVTYDPKIQDSDILVKALEMGVYECVEKPGDIESRQYNEFRLHLLTITGLLRSRKRFSNRSALNYKNKFFMPLKTADKPADKSSVPVSSMRKIDVVVVASSTGGPEILSRIFSILPGNLKVPILLVQHIPVAITQFFAKSLNDKSELDIFQASHGDEILPSKVYIAPGGQHMTVSKPDDQGKRVIRLNSRPPVNSVRPSADMLFESIARSYQGNILAIVLTGMGEDGKKGVAAMKDKGCICISQKAETCVVYGMPRAVDDAGLSDESLDPLSITQKIVMMVQ